MIHVHNVTRKYDSSTDIPPVRLLESAVDGRDTFGEVVMLMHQSNKDQTDQNTYILIKYSLR